MFLPSSFSFTPSQPIIFHDRRQVSISSTRDAQAAKCFFLKTLAASHSSEPRVINVDKNAAYPRAFNELKAEGHLPENCELRQVKYLNNLIEQDHRFLQHFVNS